MTKMVGVRVTAAQRQKLEALAAGEGVTLSSILTRLIDEVPVEQSEPVVRATLKFSVNQESSAVTVESCGAASVGN